jgi:hypothetical protein
MPEKANELYNLMQNQLEKLNATYPTKI